MSFPVCCRPTPTRIVSPNILDDCSNAQKSSQQQQMIGEIAQNAIKSPEISCGLSISVSDLRDCQGTLQQAQELHARLKKLEISAEYECLGKEYVQVLLKEHVRLDNKILQRFLGGDAFFKKTTARQLSEVIIDLNRLVDLLGRVLNVQKIRMQIDLGELINLYTACSEEIKEKIRQIARQPARPTKEQSTLVKAYLCKAHRS